MKQFTLLIRALGFLVTVGCSKARYLLVEINDDVDEYVQYDDPVYPIEYPADDNVELAHFDPIAKTPAGILYSFEKV